MAQLSVQQAFNLAVQHHQGGRLRAAEQLYRQILDQEPNHAQTWGNLGLALQAQGQLGEAMAAYRRAVVLQPDYAEAYCNLGKALKDQGQIAAAIAAYRQAVRINPNYSAAYNNLGNALREIGELDAAIVACRQAIALHPDFPAAYSNLGNALNDKGQIDLAIDAYRQAIALEPTYCSAFYNLGLVLKDKGERAAAIAAFRQAIALKPDFVAALNNLGVVLKDTGQIDAAIAVYRQAIALQPAFANAYSNLGIALRDNGELDAALAADRQAVALKPDIAEAQNNLGNTLKDRGQLDEAIAAYRQALAINPRFVSAHSNLLLGLHYHPTSTRASLFQEARDWERQHAAPLQHHIRPHTNDRNPDRRLRIGYISPDFRAHVVGRNLLPLFRQHDRQQMAITCYAQVSRPDVLTGQFQQCADSWRDITGCSAAAVADQVRADQIDILVELALHTAPQGLLILARKPAPVQVSFAGYPGTTGLTTIDYRLSDPYLDPPGRDEAAYSEQTIRLPDSFWCYDPLDERDVSVHSLPALQTGAVMFGCLNNFCKINEEILALWAQVLRQVAGSRLALLTKPGAHRQRTAEFLSRQGVAPGRLEFLDHRARRDYLEMYHRIDLGLDSFPYNGHTTSLDSFWMGVPVVTLVGPTAVSRAGWCQLSNLGLPELAGQTPEEFVRIAVALARDLPRLAELRSTLRHRMERSPLMDAPRFARHIEAAYRQMWRAWCALEPPPH